MEYRKEIDGLRALAVLHVILFYSGFEWFSGFFVGVDVFFVFSGYLITTIIISEMAQSTFSNIEQQIASIIKGNSKFQYMPFNALYLQNEKAVLDDCLIWRDADHFSICGEDIIAKKSNGGSLNHLIRVKK